jgi:hypothetical protein
MPIAFVHTQSVSLPTRTCDEIRPGRFHYQLRCCLPHRHRDEHRWTPELVPIEIPS